MIINESYFDNLEIKDEDIANDIAGSFLEDYTPPKSFKSYKELHKFYSSKYTDCVTFELYLDPDSVEEPWSGEAPDFYDQEGIKEIQKEWKKLFKKYHIRYSEIIVEDLFEDAPTDVFKRDDGWHITCVGRDNNDDDNDDDDDYDDEYYESDDEWCDYDYIRTKVTVYFNMPILSKMEGLKFIYTLLDIATQEYGTYAIIGGVNDIHAEVYINSTNCSPEYRYCISIDSVEYRDEIGSFESFLESLKDEYEQIGKERNDIERCVVFANKRSRLIYTSRN